MLRCRGAARRIVKGGGSDLTGHLPLAIGDGDARASLPRLLRAVECISLELEELRRNVIHLDRMALVRANALAIVSKRKALPIAHGDDVLELIESERNAGLLHSLQQFLRTFPTCVAEIQSHPLRLVPEDQTEELAGSNEFFVGLVAANRASVACRARIEPADCVMAAAPVNRLFSQPVEPMPVETITPLDDCVSIASPLRMR